MQKWNPVEVKSSFNFDLFRAMNVPLSGICVMADFISMCMREHSSGEYLIDLLKEIENDEAEDS